MGFFPFGRKAPSSDPIKRLEEIRRLSDRSQSRFFSMAKEDSDSGVRLAAARRVTDTDMLFQLKASTDAAVAAVAVENLSRQAAERCRDASSPERAKELLEMVRSESALSELVLRSKHPKIQDLALERLLAIAATDSATLTTIAVQDQDGRFGRAIVGRLERSALKDVSRKAKNPSVREEAAQRLKVVEAEADKPSPARRRQERRDALATICETLESMKSAAVSEIRTGLAKAETDWKAVLDQHSDLSSDDGLTAMQRRLLGIRETLTEQVSLQTVPVEETAPVPTLEEIPLATTTETEAPPVSEPVPSTPAQPLLSEEQTAAVLNLLARADQAASQADMREADRALQVLHKEMLTLSAKLPERFDLEDRFQTIRRRLKDRQEERRREQETQRLERAKILDALCGNYDTLAQSAQTAKASDLIAALKDLDQRWRQVGPLPPALLDPLRQRVNAAKDTINAVIRQQFEAQDWERFARIPKAEALIESMNALAQIEDLPAAFAKLKELQQQWKELGQLPRERSQALWDAWKASSDVQYQRLSPLFAERDAERGKNLEQKRALLDELERLVSENAGAQQGTPETIERLRRCHELLDTWDTIGHVPREESDAIWQRFRTITGSLRGQKAAHRAQCESEEKENLMRKQGLLSTAQDLLSDVELWKAGKLPGRSEGDFLRELKDLQRSWRDIGHVPRDQMDIHGRWRELCDKIWAHFGEYMEKRKALELENLAKKEAILKEFEELLTEERPHWFATQMDDIRERWRTIGQVPRDNYDTIRDRWQDLCARYDTAAQASADAAAPKE